MIKKVAVIGLWHQGVVTACYLASQSIKTIAFDSNSDRINKLNNGIQIVEEPGIKELIKTDEVSQNLLFTDSMENFESDIDLLYLSMIKMRVI
jgi:UDP-glucose 6-dehydrogenase